MAGLLALGLTDVEEAMYRHFLKHPGQGLDDLDMLLGSSADDIRGAFENLLERNLVAGDAGAVEPADPSVAVEALIEERLRWLQDELHQVSRTRHLVSELEALRPGSESVLPATERLEDVDAVRERLEDLAFFAREEILSIEPYPRYSRSNIDHARPLDMRCLRRKVTMRSIVPSEMLTDGPSTSYLRDLNSAGLQVRHQPDLSERVLVYDRTTALVPADPTDTSRGALVLHDPALVTNLISLFEKTWHAALEFTDPEGERTSHLSDIEQQVLETMCTVSKDEIGARTVGVSVRTYRRYVADLLGALGAGNRPQAALLARERGWI